MCDANQIYPLAGVDVVKALEYYGIPFTGANS